MSISSTGTPITLTTPTVIGSTNGPGDPSSPSSIISASISSSSSSTSFVNPTSTIVPTTFSSPIPSTLTPPASPSWSYPSISAISLSSISADDLTVTATSTSVVGPTITVTSVVETGVLSTETPQNASFAHQTVAIIGVTLAGILLILLIVLLIFFACKRHRANRSHNSSIEDILSTSRHTSWRPPIEEDDDEQYLVTNGRSMSPNYPKISSSQGHGEGRFFFNDHPPVGGSGGKTAFRGQPLIPSLAYTLHRSTDSRGRLISPNYSSNDARSASGPWWDNTEPLNVVKHNTARRLVDSHVSPIGTRSASSLELSGGSSSSTGYHGPGSSGEALLPITEPRSTHKLSGRRRHYSTPPPTAFTLGRDSSVQYGMQRIRELDEERKLQDRADRSISQIILARLRAGRRPSTATTEAYSHSEGSTSSHAYPPSLLNPSVPMSQAVPRPRGGPGNSSHRPANTINQHHYPRQGVGDTPDDLPWPTFPLPTAPSPVPSIDTGNMVEGLLHPRLGIALTESQRASFTSFRDHEDYTRPINGLVNNYIPSSTTFALEDTVDPGEGGV